MIKITGDTTLADLHITLTKLGVVNVTFNVSFETRKPVNAVLTTLSFRAIGAGQTLYEALDDALARIWHREAATTTQDPSTATATREQR